MQNELCKILDSCKSVVVIGLSKNPNKTSRLVAEYLRDNGFRVVGVNPTAQTIEGFEVYKTLADVPFKADIVNVFRKSEDIPNLIADVLNYAPNVFWLQLGIRNDIAAQPVEDAGITVVQDQCIKIVHKFCNQT